MPYSSPVTVALDFGERDIPRPPDSSGFLVPRRERRRLAAATCVGTKFPHRGPVLVRCFLGGAECWPRATTP